MAHAFQPIPANVTFQQVKEPGFASDYISNKKSYLAYCNKKSSFDCKRRLTQGEYLLYNDGRSLTTGLCSPFFNNSNLVSNLYSKENLSGVCTVSDTTSICAPKIDPSLTTPFYNNYIIDPNGALFGRTPCGLNNYVAYMTPSIQTNNN